MSDEPEPYRRAIWQQVKLIEQLKDDDVVELRDSNGNNYARYRVRIEEIRGGGVGARFKDPEDFNVNVHFHAGACALVESGLVYRRLMSQVCEFDVWATEYEAWSYRPLTLHDRPWFALATGYNRLDAEIPDDAKLMWRQAPQPVEE